MTTIKPETFSRFTYSLKSHFSFFDQLNYDVELYGSKFNPDDEPLKKFQDLLVFAFIKQNIPPGSCLLDVGGGTSRIISFFKNQYECWNVDKLEGVGNGPLSLQVDGFRLVRDYIGNFNSELPSNYFDLVFSISVLEHLPEDENLFSNVLNDMDRVLKSGAYSLHCLDVSLRAESYWMNKFLPWIYENRAVLNEFVSFDRIRCDSDLFVMSKKRYELNWQPLVNRTYEDFGMPFSYNILWQKSSDS